MAESVRLVGIQTPAIVRQKEDGRYELVSGHRRRAACEIAGVDTLPCIVREMTHDEAVVAMVDSNLQCENILPSEKAKSYKMRLEAMRRQAGRPSRENYSPVGNNLLTKTSSEELSELTNESKNQIFRYIRLNDLIPQLLDMVDAWASGDKGVPQIAMRPAVELSYLSHESQQTLLEAIETEECTPSHVQAMKMRKFEVEGRLSGDVILSIMQEQKPNQAEQFRMPKERIDKYFPPGTSAQKMEDTIVKALELYRQRERNREAR
jgi:ParB family chromosome partitioning protein